ncbi:glycosyl hydrolases family 31-domain-containing protein [Dactylonectria macrodidyma]|uniref:Glycosyl hydrolases family 31-domain-containing protein n=1 Tax=Dactylonectria macrodidyma TaxID=307937 RepID=A0A9P9IDZ1_9HYPO|nr:glycosyl hydrolases family 31-domain-containing protein [Dactylonectria macrodidyma]
MFFYQDGVLGANAFRVRVTKSGVMPTQDWALQQLPPTESQISTSDDSSSIINGKAKAIISRLGKITIENSEGKLVLEEYARNRRDILDPKCSAIEVEARELRPIPGADNYHLTMRLESIDPNEKIFGMGQYQQHHMNLKCQDLVFGTNIMSFEAYSTNPLDYWIVLGDTPAEIEEAYAEATGKVPMMPECGLGFWQCKLRYQTQEELLEVVREYQLRDIPLGLIVIGFFHCPKQGEWKFDPLYWPDPDARVNELKEMNIELMVSIWPTVDKKSENYQHMVEHGYLIRTDRGVRTGLDFGGETMHIDATNPEARQYLWKTVKENYYSKGIKTFWLDEAEPEYTAYDFDNYRYFLGSNLTIGNIYPVDYAKAFYEGMISEGQMDVVNMLRCAWADSQNLRNQLTAGLNMAMAGFPWWTTDIGGFHGGDPDDEKFRELFVRWFRWGTFCPVMRLHDDRELRQPQVRTSGGATCCSGAANEVWSYGPDVYDICRRYIQIREELRDYTRKLMRAAHDKGSPIMRPLFYEFPEDKNSWEVSTQYMYGDKYLVCPVLSPELKNMVVYLPPLETGKKWTAL